MTDEKRFCGNCKYYDCDYEYDDDICDEVEIEHCEKWGDNLMDAENCPYYDEREPCVYHEEYTECDKCEYQSDCIKYGYIDCTTIGDSMTHIICSREHCRKKGDTSG